MNVKRNNNNNNEKIEIKIKLKNILNWLLSFRKNAKKVLTNVLDFKWKNIFWICNL